MVLMILIPIIIQNGITNFVSLLDNIMVGQVGTEQMSGVSIANQLIMVFNLCVFGAVSGAGIFGAQFYGKGDQEGVRYSLRYKLIISAIIFTAGVIIFCTAGDKLIQLYLQGESQGSDPEKMFRYGKTYLLTMLPGLLPFAMVQSYSSTLRECGETVLPMKAGILSVFVNLILNYLLIFGKFGFPELGAVGAAVATVIARYVEFLIVVVWTHTHLEKNAFARGLYRNFRIPLKLAGQIFRTGTPLMINETLWSAGMATLTQCYSVRGLEVVAGLNITSTISNLFSVVYIALGTAVAIVVGQLLGANKLEEAKETDYKLLFFAVVAGAAVGVVLLVFAPVFPNLYNTAEEVRNMARNFIIVFACCMPLQSFCNATYFTLRSGGKTILTFGFDCGYLWLLAIPVAFILSRFTTLPILPIYAIIQGMEFIKCVIGFILVKKGIWIHRFV